MAGDATIREARDIISRWSSNDLLDRISSLPAIPEMSTTIAGKTTTAERTSSTRSSLPNGDHGQFSEDDQETANHQDSKSDQEATDAMKDEFDASSRSILDEIDKLAQRSRLSNEDDSGSPYLKLTEIDRPEQSAPTVNVAGLYSQQSYSPKIHSPTDDAENSHPPEPETQPAPFPEHQPQQDQITDEAAAEQLVVDSETEKTAAAQTTPKAENEQTPLQEPPSKASTAKGTPQKQTETEDTQQAPLLSSLLRESKSESVGQLAWWNLTERLRPGRQRKSQEVAAKLEDSEFAQAQAELLAAADSVDPKEPSQAAQSTQLASAVVQTKNRPELEAQPDSVADPVNLTASDQPVQKPSNEAISPTDSEELSGNKPILPEEIRGTDEEDQQPVDPARKRVAQPRRAQRRKQHPRNLRNDPADFDDADQKGTKTVSRKYRVDNPNPEPVAPAMATDGQTAPASPAAGSNANSSSRRFRIDPAEDLDEVLGTGDNRSRTRGPSRRRYIDEPHADAIRGPHFQVVSKKRSNMASMTGQFLAYLGVLGLTVGTAIVIYGHFGGVSEYTPTGWLVTTVAQMMLFLGVINLVSGGIEQNNEDVSTRINTLGEQLIRIEQVTEQALKGPKIAASRYANPDAAVDESRVRESVEVQK